MNYRIYGSGTKGYENIGYANAEIDLFNKLESIVDSEKYNKYLIIEEVDNSDIPYGLFYDKQGYEELKQEKVKKKVIK